MNHCKSDYTVARGRQLNEIEKFDNCDKNRTVPEVCVAALGPKPRDAVTKLAGRLSLPALRRFDGQHRSLLQPGARDAAGPVRAVFTCFALRAPGCFRS